jgi:hypothetical protein
MGITTPTDHNAMLLKLRGTNSSSMTYWKTPARHLGSKLGKGSPTYVAGASSCKNKAA